MLSLVSAIYMYKTTFVSKHDVDYFVNEFAKLSYGKMPDGEYSGSYENADTFNVFVYMVVVTWWRGGVLSNNTWKTLTHGIDENGSVTNDAISVMDKRSCVRIDLPGRFYEIRQRPDGSYSNIVRDNNTNEILDINVLRLSTIKRIV